MRHKVGDKVKVKTWESMEKEFGLNNDGDIDGKTDIFTTDMKKYCGKYIIIESAFPSYYYYADGYEYCRADRMFEEENKEELKKGDIVYVSDNSKEDCIKYKKERILIAKSKGFYLCVTRGYEEKYNEGNYFFVDVRKYAVKKPLEEKKERKIMMTDIEWEEFKKKNNF